MPSTSASAPDPHNFVLSNLTPSPAQKRLALGVLLTSLVVFFIAAGPLSSYHLARIDAFVPIYATAMFVIDMLTAILLFTQFAILRSRALLVISSGYLFTALILIPWMLTFPGVFAPGGLIGARLQSTAWLYIAWHAGFPVFIIAYALLKDAPTDALWRGSVAAAILTSIAMTTVVVCIGVIVATAGEPLLPALMLDAVRLSTLWPYAAGAAALLSVLALLTLWVRRRSVLDMWLMIVMCAYVIEICLISFPVPARYSVGWYSGRIFGALSGSLVLIVLLSEITTLYARLLRAVSAERLEREARLMTGDAIAATIAHEVTQPLQAIVLNADTSLRLLDHSVPDLDRAKVALKRISAASHRAADVIANIRASFKQAPPNRVSLNVNELVAEALASTRDVLQRALILVRVESSGQPHEVKGDRTQLLQVLINLIVNAVDSMADNDGPRVLSVKSELDDDGVPMVSVTDTGAGISAQDVDRIFNPRFTTKSHGMGMGLAICRSIVEAHGGRLWASHNTPRGAVFRFVLATDAEKSAPRPEQRAS